MCPDNILECLLKSHALEEFLFMRNKEFLFMGDICIPRVKYFIEVGIIRKQ